MAAVSTLSASEERMPSEKNLLAMELVEQESHIAVPNYLIDTKIYSRISRNAFVEAQPMEIHFAGFNIPSEETKSSSSPCYTRTLRLTNVCSEVTRFHIIPPEDTAHFTLKYTKPARLVPGFAVECQLEFRPDETRYYYDVIRIHSKDEANNLIVPIHAYPILGADLPFPKHLKFEPVPVGYQKTKVLPVRCEAPVDFEFKITILQDHPAIQIEPLSGVVPANGFVDIVVAFAPVDFVTAHLSMQFSVSQFNSEPLICHISGVSEPGLERNKMIGEWMKSREASGLINDSSVLDPRVLSPLDRARSRKVMRLRKNASGSSSGKGCDEDGLERGPSGVIERAGLRIPVQLNNPYAVGQVLSQEPGKLKIKELREVLNKGENRIDATRQMKEAVFEQEVRQNVYEERQNQLRWQIRVGDEPLTSTARQDVLQQRKQAWVLYQRKRGVPVPEEELERCETSVIDRRTYRDSSLIAADNAAKFDRYQNDDWASRQDCLERFRQAARKVIIRMRADKKITGLKQLVLDWGRGKYSSTVTDEIKQKEAADEELFEDVMAENSLLAAHRIGSQRFPTWGEAPSLAAAVKSGTKGPDMFSVPATEIILRPNYDFFNLKVPKVFQLNNYEALDVHDQGRGYVPVRAIRQLKSGALDEIITLPNAAPLVLPEQQGKTEPDMRVEDIEAATPAPEEDEEALARRVLLKPPAMLFQPMQYPPLHIFNPAPGMQVFEQPQAYSETDPDYRLCPLPRYTARDPSEANPFTTTQKRYLDREDVIRGLTTWKTFPSPGLTSLGNTPTLTSVWVPRWSEAFASELLPSFAPPLVDGLPSEDEENLLELGEDGEERQIVVLTPEMVAAEFGLNRDATVQGEDGGDATTVPAAPETNEEFPYGNKMPPSNIPVSATGPVARWTRENELEFFLNKKSNRLGSRVGTRVSQMDSLVRHTHRLPLV